MAFVFLLICTSATTSSSDDDFLALKPSTSLDDGTNFLNMEVAQDAGVDDGTDPLGSSQGAGAGGDDQDEVGQDDFGFPGAGASSNRGDMDQDGTDFLGVGASSSSCTRAGPPTASVGLKPSTQLLLKRTMSKYESIARARESKAKLDKMKSDNELRPEIKSIIEAVQKRNTRGKTVTVSTIKGTRNVGLAKLDLLLRGRAWLKDKVRQGFGLQLVGRDWHGSDPLSTSRASQGCGPRSMGTAGQGLDVPLTGRAWRSGDLLLRGGALVYR